MSERTEPNLFAPDIRDAIRTPSLRMGFSSQEAEAKVVRPAHRGVGAEPLDLFSVLADLETRRLSLGAAYVYLLLLGWAGFHRFYTGRILTGLLVAAVAVATALFALYGYAVPMGVAFNLGKLPGYPAICAAGAVIVSVVCAFDFARLPRVVARHNVGIVAEIERGHGLRHE